MKKETMVKGQHYAKGDCKVEVDLELNIYDNAVQNVMWNKICFLIYDK